jgi:hypothetical protein
LWADKQLSAIQRSLIENTGTWLLIGALVVVGYWGYSERRDLDEVCDLAQEANEISAPAPLDPSGKPIAPTDLKAQLAELKRLNSEHTVDGELWRWQKFDGEKIDAICGSSREDETQ